MSDLAEGSCTVTGQVCSMLCCGIAWIMKESYGELRVTMALDQVFQSSTGVHDWFGKVATQLQWTHILSS